MSIFPFSDASPFSCSRLRIYDLLHLVLRDGPRAIWNVWHNACRQDGVGVVLALDLPAALRKREIEFLKLILLSHLDFIWGLGSAFSSKWS